MPRRFVRNAAWILAWLCVMPRGAGAQPRRPDFPAAAAWRHLVAQCGFGPRVPGTEAHARCLSYLEDALRRVGGDVSLERFRSKIDARRDSVDLANVCAHYGPGGRTVLLGAHWDSRPWADQDPDSSKRSAPILGANDGASGVAVLLALAELMQAAPPPIGIEIVLFDGEDQGREGDLAGYFLGSREHARRLVPPMPAAVIVIDMVGGKDLHICREGYSQEEAGWLNDLLFARAKALGLDGFEDRVCYSVMDDHAPFLEAGIPAIDIVDMHFRQWHTTDDMPRACSQESLEEVGSLLVDFLYGGSLQ